MRFLALVVLALFAAISPVVAADAADDQSHEARFISHTRQLIFEGKRSGEGYFHPDGNLLIFQSEREEGNPFYQMYLLDLLSGETARVSPGIGKTTCGFFQPGTGRVLFASTHEDPAAAAKQKTELEFRASGKQRRYAWDYDASMDIYSCNQDGTQIVNLTHSPGYDAEGSYSPDGKHIVFCSLRGAFPLEKLSPELRARYEKDPAWFGDIYIMDADGGNVRQLTDAPGYDGGPFFSPDGKRIVWRHFDESGFFADVWTMNTDGSDKRRITDFKSMSWAPFYHPSGKYIIFTSNKLGFSNFELFIVDVEGKHEPVRVTFTDGFDGLPVFSPDGKKLSWTSGRTSDGKSQIFMADWNHEAALQAIQQSPLREEPHVPIPPSADGAPGEAAVPAKKGAAVASTSADASLSTLTPEITAQDLKTEVSWLAAPEREGRMTGEPGARASAEWLASYFRANGLKPGDGDSYFDDFPYFAGEFIRPELCGLSVKDANHDTTFTVEKDFRPLEFSESGEASGEVVFAGYGLSVPEGKGPRYNSYEGLDVKDKVVLILRYVPEAVDAPRRAQLNRYSGLRYKVMMARERGAKAVLVVTGPNSPNAGELLPLGNDGSNSGSGIIAQSINFAAADALLASSGKSLKDMQTSLDSENPHAAGGFLLPGVTAKVSAKVEHIGRGDRNVLAAIPPPAGSEEYVIVGAHYDHLGYGRAGTSMARSGEEGKIHPGADDNASGTATVMEIAASLQQEHTAHPEKFKRGVIFALWSGEEIGLFGSAAFCEKPPLPLSNVAAYVNFDMVGRLHDNKLTMQGVASSKLWKRELEKRNVAAGFDLTLQDDPYLPTDTTSFYPKRIPVLNFFTGSHEDYHRPTDTADKVNYEGLERIAKFARQIVLDLATAPERPDFARVEHSESSGGSRDTLRAYLGTIPDYSTEVKGVKLSGVRAESPAEKGGLKGGDVIVEFAGQKIANIYDYTYALDAVKIGQPVKVTVEREGKREDLTVTPEARK